MRMWGSALSAPTAMAAALLLLEFPVQVAKPIYQGSPSMENCAGHHTPCVGLPCQARREQELRAGGGSPQLGEWHQLECIGFQLLLFF